MSDWHPIETAPRTCEVLTYGPLKDASGFYYEVQKWWDGRHPGWPVKWMANCLEPTHWQPLPDPPK
jgi:hypothetical protein